MKYFSNENVQFILTVIVEDYDYVNDKKERIYIDFRMDIDPK